jgi:hypothetical protein
MIPQRRETFANANSLIFLVPSAKTMHFSLATNQTDGITSSPGSHPSLVLPHLYMLDVFLAGGGGISRSKEDYEAHKDKEQG